MSSELDDLTKYMKKKLRDTLMTSTPARIVGIDEYNSSQLVDVQPVILEADDSGVLLEPAVIYRVPVQLYSGGGAIISVPVAVGDIVQLHFQLSDIDKWKVSDGETLVSPESKRKFNTSDAIAVPCLATTQTTLNPDSTNLDIRFGNTNISISPEGKVVVNSGEIELGEGATEGVILGTSFQIFFDAHTHAVSGSNTLIPSVLMASQPTLISTKTKVL